MKIKTVFVILILFFFGIILYLPFIEKKEFQGEEGRRVLIALQMLENKEFLIPKQFDKPYFHKPPLFNWALAIIFKITGNYSEFTARTFSSLCLIFTSLFLTLIWKNILTKIPSETKKTQLIEIILPGLIFLTTPEVIDKALRAEIDGFYTMLITIAVYSWFYFYEMKNKKTSAYVISGFFLGLGILTKTFHALIFFYFAILPYLIFKKKIKELFGFHHLLGIVTYLGVFFVWVLLVSLKIGFKPFFITWFEQYLSIAKAQEMSPFQHFKAYTIFAFLGYSPWLWFLVFYKNKNFLSFLKSHSLFYNLVIFSTSLFFLSYFFHFMFPGARLRYMLPSVGGVIFLSCLVIYYFIKQNLLPKFYKLLLFRWFPFINLIISIIFFIYLSFSHYTPEPIFYCFYSLFFILNLYILIKNFSSPLVILYFLLATIFLLKSLYVAFYYPLHQKTLNHFRNAALEIAKLIEDKKELYLCRTIPHHLIYYLKYKYRSVDTIYYLKDCSMLPKKSYILFDEKNINKEILKNYEIHPLKIRTKKYFLIKS